MKKSYGVVAALAAGGLLLALLFADRLPAVLGREAGEAGSPTAADAAVAYIDDIPVDQREFGLVLNQVKAQVASYFKTTYDADASPAFWTTSYQGEVPLEKARLMAMEQIKRVKMEQLLAQRNGWLDDPSYSSFLDNWGKENRRRAEAVKRNEVVYGPKQYDEWSYYMYRNTTLKLELQRLLFEKEGPLPEQEVRDAYEEWKASSYADVEEIKTLKIELSYSAESEGAGALAKPEVKAKVEEIKRRLEQGEEPEAISRSLERDTGAGWKVGEFAVNEETLSKRDLNTPDEAAIEEALRLPEGGVSKVFENGDSFAVLLCLERKGGGYRPYGEVKDEVERRLFEAKLDSEIDGLVAEAKVTLVEQVYQSIRL